MFLFQVKATQNTSHHVMVEEFPALGKSRKIDVLHTKVCVLLCMVNAFAIAVLIPVYDLG